MRVKCLCILPTDRTYNQCQYRRPPEGSIFKCDSLCDTDNPAFLSTLFFASLFQLKKISNIEHIMYGVPYNWIFLRGAIFCEILRSSLNRKIFNRKKYVIKCPHKNTTCKASS